MFLNVSTQFLHLFVRHVIFFPRWEAIAFITEAHL